MKKIKLLFIAISIFANLNAQDIIIKKTGVEIKTKITEVGLDNVKFKKYDNIEGPIYTITKDEIFMIKYENGSKDVFKDNAKEVVKKVEKSKNDYLRKGLHLGFHITPGIGSIIFSDYDIFAFGIHSGLDINIYLNDYVGIKTGISYLNLPCKTSGNYYEGNFGSKGSVNSLGIPIKFLLTTHDKVGFYLASGLNIYFPVSSKHNHHTVYSNNPNDYEDLHQNFHSNVVIVGETVLGFNMKISNITSLNLGMFYHRSLTNYVDESTGGYYYSNYRNTGKHSKGTLVGLQMGILFNLTK